MYRAVFGLMSALRPPRPRGFELSSSSRVLVFTSAGLGDTLLDSVAIRALAETFPGIRIHAVAHHRRPDICRHNPFVRRVHLLRKGPPAFVALWRELRAAGPWDGIFYLSCLDPEARALGYLLAPDLTCGPKWRTDFAHLCALNVDGPQIVRAHLCEQALKVVEPAGARAECPRMVYEVSAEERETLGRFLAECGFPAKPTVTFQLGGGGAGYRDWPAERFVTLAKTLHAEGIGPIFLLGGPDHKAKASQVEKALAGVPVYNLTGRIPLPLSAALVECSKCVVSTDTGIMHMAFAVGTPTVALLHPRPGPARVGPFAEADKHRVIALQKPEGYKKPEDAEMRNIAVEPVAAAVREILARAVRA